MDTKQVLEQWRETHRDTMTDNAIGMSHSVPMNIADADSDNAWIMVDTKRWRVVEETADGIMIFEPIPGMHKEAIQRIVNC